MFLDEIIFDEMFFYKKVDDQNHSGQKNVKRFIETKTNLHFSNLKYHFLQKIDQFLVN
jgi:hypothetical protein